MKLSNATAAWMALGDADFFVTIEESNDFPLVYVEVFVGDNHISFLFESTSNGRLIEIFLYNCEIEFNQFGYIRYSSDNNWQIAPPPHVEVQNAIDIVFKELGIK